MKPKALECGGKTPLYRASKRCHGTALQGASRTKVETLSFHALGRSSAHGRLSQKPLPDHLRITDANA